MWRAPQWRAPGARENARQNGKQNVRIYGDWSKPWYLVNPKIAGKWMFIPLKMVLIGIDPYPYARMNA